MDGLVIPLDFLIRVNIRALRGLNCPILQRPLCRLFSSLSGLPLESSEQWPEARFAPIGTSFVIGHARAKGNTRVRHYKEQQRTFVLSLTHVSTLSLISDQFSACCVSLRRLATLPPCVASVLTMT